MNVSPTNIDEAAERAVFQSHWCPPDYDETPGFEVHKQFAINAWLARARIAAQREAELVKDAEACGKVRVDHHGDWSIIPLDDLSEGTHLVYLRPCAPITEAAARDALRIAIDRIEDMLNGDDGQAWKEAERVLPRLRAAIAQERK